MNLYIILVAYPNYYQISSVYLGKLDSTMDIICLHDTAVSLFSYIYFLYTARLYVVS